MITIRSQKDLNRKSVKDKKDKMAKQIVLTSILIILLLGAFGYIGYIQYGNYQENKQITAYATFQQGAQYGYEQAVSQLYTEALKCQPVPVTFNNQSLNMIAVECLQAAQQNQQNQQQTQTQ